MVGLTPMKSSIFRRDLLWLLWLVLTSVLLGQVINLVRASPLPFRYETKQERLEAGVKRLEVLPVAAVNQEVPVSAPAKLTLSEFLAARATGAVLDARPSIFYRLGHVPGALSLPRENFEKVYAQLGARLGKEQVLTVYCASETCVDAELVHAALVRLGHKQVQIFTGGWAEWQAAGHQEEKGP